MLPLNARLRAGAALAALCTTTLGSTIPALAHGDHGGAADGSVLPAGVTLVTLQYDYVDYRRISDARLTELATVGVAEVHSLRSIAVPSLALSYGLTKDFTISARLPYLANREIRETDPDAPGVNPRGGVYGFGDASFSGTYRFYNDVHNRVEAALLFGIKAPTGRTDAVDQLGERFETEHQPGSGSWDTSIGGALSKQTSLWSFGINAFFTRAGNGAQETRLGNRMSYGISAGYRLWSDGGASSHAMHLGNAPEGMMRHGVVDHSTPTGMAKSIEVSLGLNGQWSGMQNVAGELDHNTGGNAIYLTPGARLTVDKWSVFGSVGIPVARQFNGIRSEPRLQATTGLSVRF